MRTYRTKALAIRETIWRELDARRKADRPKMSIAKYASEVLWLFARGALRIDKDRLAAVMKAEMDRKLAETVTGMPRIVGIEFKGFEENDQKHKRA